MIDLKMMIDPNMMTIDPNMMTIDPNMMMIETSINVLITEDQVDRPKGSSSEGILRTRTLRKGFKLQTKKRQDIQLRLSVYREKSPD